jgi:hypothetical protein
MDLWAQIMGHNAQDWNQNSFGIENGPNLKTKEVLTSKLGLYFFFLSKFLIFKEIILIIF